MRNVSYLGAISESGTVGIEEDGSLSFAEDISRGDITLSNGSEVDVRGAGGGNIKVDVRNLNLEGGERGVSRIRAGIRENSTSIEAQAGDITIDATGNISLDEGRVTNNQDGGIGNSGNIFITTDSLSLLNGSDVGSNTFGTGDAGAVQVTATGDITASGENSEAFPSSISSQVNPGAEGNSGGVTISTTNLNLSGGATVSASTFGTGDAGAIQVTATGDITASGEDSEAFPSSISSEVSPGAEGNSGGVTISTTNLNLSGGARVGASTQGTGDAGAIQVTATGDIAVDGEQSEAFPSGIDSGVNSDAEGNSGVVSISTNNLNLTNGGSVEANTQGTGDAGAIQVMATGDITADGDGSEGSPSGITSQVGSDGEGNSGGVTISTTNLNLTAGGRVAADILGTGNAGAVQITATGDIIADGEGLDGFSSGITSLVNFGAEGNSGGVTISTTNLNLSAGGRVSAGTGGTGDAGAVQITATGDIIVDGEGLDGIPSGITSQVGSGAEGSSGGVTISTTNLNLSGGSGVDASVLGTGNAGAVQVKATGNIIVGGESSEGSTSGISSGVNTGAEGNSGGVTISTTNLNLSAGGRVTAGTLGTGDAGAVQITATGDIIVDGEGLNGIPSGITSSVNTGAEGSSGGVTITTTNLNLSAGGLVDVSTLGTGDAGGLIVEATESITIDGFIERFRSGISANAFNENGNGGDISVSTGKLTIANGGTIEATNFEDTGLVTSPGTGRPGTIDITADAIELTENARIEAVTQSTEGESGSVKLKIAEDITLQNNSSISAQALGEANGGNLDIDSRFIIAFPNGDNDIIANAQQGNGGSININAESLLGIADRPLNDTTNDINASSEFSLDGNVTISTPDVNPAQGATELPTNVVELGETTAQACEANRESAAKNGLNITGKGGIPAEPGLTLNSLNVAVSGEDNSTSTIPAPTKTAKGKVQPARGIKISKTGEIVLTAYRTNNAGERIPEIKENCDQF